MNLIYRIIRYNVIERLFNIITQLLNNKKGWSGISYYKYHKYFIVVEEIFHFLTTVSRKKGVNLLTFQEPDLLHNFFII